MQNVVNQTTCIDIFIIFVKNHFMEEIWKPIKGFEKYYLISNLGNVQTIKTGKLRKTQKNDDGYLCLLFCVNYIRYTKYIHRLIAEAFIENPLNLPEVNHINGIKLDNSIKNLEWCTHQNNMVHAHKTELIKQARGIKCLKSVKLTEEQVKEIQNLKGKLSGLKIAKIYGVSDSQIYRILNNQSWKHL